MSSTRKMSSPAPDATNSTSRHPFGLPRGTIRSFISIIIIGAIVGLAVYETMLTKKVPMWFPPLAATIITYYFNQRDKDGQTPNHDG